MAGFDTFLSVVNAAEDREARKDAQLLDMAKFAMGEQTHKLDILHQEKVQKENQLQQLNMKLIELGITEDIKNPVVKKTLNDNIVSDAVDLKGDLNSLNEAITGTMKRMGNIYRGYNQISAKYQPLADTEGADADFYVRSRINDENEIDSAGKLTGLEGSDLSAAINLAQNANEANLFSEFIKEKGMAINEEEANARIAAANAQKRLAERQSKNENLNKFLKGNKFISDVEKEIAGRLVGFSIINSGNFWVKGEDEKPVLNPDVNNAIGVIRHYDKQLGNKLQAVVNRTMPSLDGEGNYVFPVAATEALKYNVVEIAQELSKLRNKEGLTESDWDRIATNVEYLTGISSNKLLAEGGKTSQYEALRNVKGIMGLVKDIEAGGDGTDLLAPIKYNPLIKNQKKEGGYVEPSEITKLANSLKAMNLYDKTDGNVDTLTNKYKLTLEESMDALDKGSVDLAKSGKEMLGIIETAASFENNNNVIKKVEKNAEKLRTLISEYKNKINKLSRKVDPKSAEKRKLAEEELSKLLNMQKVNADKYNKYIEIVDWNIGG